MKIIGLCAALWVTIAGVDEKKAEELVILPLKIWPCHAIRGNVDVGFVISTRVSKD